MKSFHASTVASRTVLLVAASFSCLAPLCAWESKLFPRSGAKYAYAEAPGGFRLPDFSYAGYRGGEKELPQVKTVATVAPAGPDDTAAIQKAIDEMPKPGALLLRAGTYSISGEIVLPPGSVLRGEGAKKTFICVKTSAFKSKAAVVGFRSPSTKPARSMWTSAETKRKAYVDDDIPKGVTSIKVPQVDDFPVDSWVVVKNEIRQAQESDPLRTEYNGATSIDGTVLWPSDWVAFKFMRRVVAHKDGAIVLDHGTRHLLQKRDFAQVMEAPPMGEEIGVEDLSIGFLRPDDYDTYHSLTSAGEKAPYHSARAVCFGNVRNGWIVRVASYSPGPKGVHLLSCGIMLESSKWVTVKECVMQDPANLGGGGNGYGFSLLGSDECLIVNCSGIDCRHNFMFSMAASGNVISDCTSTRSRYGDDSHQGMSCENLVENMSITAPAEIGGGFVWGIQSRGKTSAGAGQCGADNVFWRVLWDDKRFSLISDQAHVNGSRGYVIGAAKVKEVKDPKGEWREGIGEGKGLTPASLWRTQLRLRHDRQTKAGREAP